MSVRKLMKKDILRRLREFSNDDLLAIYNHFAQIPMENITDRLAAEHRVADLLLPLQLLPSTRRNAFCVDHIEDKAIFFHPYDQDPEMVWARSAESRRIRDTDVIILLVDKNPKRVGSRSWARFNEYRNGMRVSEWCTALARNHGYDGISKAMADLDFDTKHGFIQIVREDVAKLNGIIE